MRSVKLFDISPVNWPANNAAMMTKQDELALLERLVAEMKVGRVFSAANHTRLKAIAQQLSELLSQIENTDEDSEKTLNIQRRKIDLMLLNLQLRGN